MKEVEITYRLEKSEFVKHRMISFLKKRSWMYLLFIVFICLITILPEFLPGATGDGLEDLSFSSFLPIIVVPLLIIGLIWFSFGKAYDNTKGMNGEIHVKIDEAGYHVKTELAESSHQWPAILKVIKKGDMMDVYYNKVAYSNIPMRCIKPQDLITLKEILDSSYVKNNL